MKFASPYHREKNGKCKNLNGITKSCLSIMRIENKIKEPPLAYTKLSLKNRVADRQKKYKWKYYLY